MKEQVIKRDPAVLHKKKKKKPKAKGEDSTGKVDKSSTAESKQVKSRKAGASEPKLKKKLTKSKTTTVEKPKVGFIKILG
jgi:hypothetical protein